MDNKVFESYPVPKAVATLALPTVLSMLVTIFYNMADTFLSDRPETQTRLRQCL
ncbi:hypothetical protein [Anaerostipes caccae]|uniref:hypothetical protein n=1 Tax=Anaerostipes caccae TaxID=105841 RepID=UPI002670E8A0|nr:hypothetical protein [Anaerostipes caccae]